MGASGLKVFQSDHDFDLLADMMGTTLKRIDKEIRSKKISPRRVAAEMLMRLYKADLITESDLDMDATPSRAERVIESLERAMDEVGDERRWKVYSHAEESLDDAIRETRKDIRRQLRFFRRFVDEQ